MSHKHRWTPARGRTDDVTHVCPCGAVCAQATVLPPKSDDPLSRANLLDWRQAVRSIVDASIPDARQRAAAANNPTHRAYWRGYLAALDAVQAVTQ